MIDHVLAFPEGYRLHEYTIRETLGFGGFGITYKALDNNLHKIVAIKEYLPSDLAVRLDGSTVSVRSEQDREGFEWGRERFLAEARTIARFDHPNIIRIYRFFKQNGTGYIVMEYVDGRPLSQVLDQSGTLEESQIRAWLWPILDGLKVVHQANFLHRDIKPQNIMIRNDGNPVLLDFGAARMAIGGHTRSLTSILTPGFAPLEQYQSRGNQGPWTDIYALGAVIYRCISGEKPRDALDRVSNDALELPDDEAQAQYSRGLVKGVMAALSLRESERPQSIGQWMAMLEDDSEVPTRIMPAGLVVPDVEPESDTRTSGPVNPGETGKRSGRSGPGKWVLAALPILLFIAVASFWMTRNLPRPQAVQEGDTGAPVDSSNSREVPFEGMKITSSPGGASIYVDGEYSGIAPATIHNFERGRTATVRASLDGYQPVEQEVTAPSEGLGEVTLILEKIPPEYALTIETDPPDAVIRFLNTSETYQRGMNLEPGRYEVEVSRSGYQTISRTLNIVDEALTIPISLRPNETALQSDAGTQPVDSSANLIIITGCQDKNPLEYVSPRYPQEAASRGVEGLVTLEFTVDPEGRVVDPKVKSAEPQGLFESAALDAIKQFRYRPNTFGGLNQPCLGRQELRFQPEVSRG